MSTLEYVKHLVRNAQQNTATSYVLNKITIIR